MMVQQQNKSSITRLLLSLILLVLFSSFSSGVHALSDDVFAKLESVFRNNGAQVRESTATTTATTTPNITGRSSGSVSSLARMGDTTITITINTDDYPEDFGFTLAETNDAGVVVASAAVGSLTGQPNIAYTEVVEVTAGEEYTLTVYDDFVDNFGSVNIFSGTSSLVFLSEIEDAETSVIFTVPFPSNSANDDSNGNAREGTTSPSPTHAPTSCGVPDGAYITEGQSDFAPRFFSEETAHPELADSAVCSRHGTYVDCTNERAIDCQWLLTRSSPQRFGVCRIDPVAACIANGNCQCDTVDFKGGPATFAAGGSTILFHAPISVTAADISTNRASYYEVYTAPETRDPLHPQEETDFVSRIDFTNRVIHYDLSTAVDDGATVAFKLHYLYWELDLVGTIWRGANMIVGIDTTTNTISINDFDYVLPAALKKWTCSSIVITKDALFVGRTIIDRQLNQETDADIAASEIDLGPFSGQLFDVRLYSGTLGWSEIREVGAKCTTPDDPAALTMRRDVINPYFIRGCEPSFEGFHADEGGFQPSDGIQTYGSGAFATLWLKPLVNGDDYIDIPEGQFDAELYFQQAKLQEYTWERFFFEVDMIGFNQAPYRYLSLTEVPNFSATFYNNPCRYMNNFNNAWQYPIYELSIEKYRSGTLDVNVLFEKSPAWADMGYLVHEIYHGFQGHMIDVNAGFGSRWLAESSASFASLYTFVGAYAPLAPLGIAPGYPLGLLYNAELGRGSHFASEELSINEWIQGGHIYSSGFLWWFLAEHAGLPGMLAEIYSMHHKLHSLTAGEIFHVREIVENADMDFGDVWATSIAHTRTWDLKFGEVLKANEQIDLDAYKSIWNYDNPLPQSTTMEDRKTSASIDPFEGTNGELVAGPEALRPGPNGWNGLTMRGVEADRTVSITIKWDDGMGFSDQVLPSYLPEQQAGCDDDPRFFNNVVVVHNEATDERRYWKLKGKAPPTLNIATGDEGPVTIHVLLVPTPPADYVTGRSVKEGPDSDDILVKIPIYSYSYAFDVSDSGSFTYAPQAEMDNGMMKFDKATPGWWPVECTCLEDPNRSGNRCVRPRFDGVGRREGDINPVVAVTPPPSPRPTPDPSPRPTPSPTNQPTPFPTDQPTLAPITAQPTPAPSPLPTPFPTAQPTPAPSPLPTPLPTAQPTPAPSPLPTPFPTAQPTPAPSPLPTPFPTAQPTPAPSPLPTPFPTAPPTPAPSPLPTPFPTPAPSPLPTLLPITDQPAAAPSSPPTPAPSPLPTPFPTIQPTPAPSPLPTPFPTIQPTPAPSPLPTLLATAQPTPEPSPFPVTLTPSVTATTPVPVFVVVTAMLTLAPSDRPTPSPTPLPTRLPTRDPTKEPTPFPTSDPTPRPTVLPTPFPTSMPTPLPTPFPTNIPTSLPTPLPTEDPTLTPVAPIAPVTSGFCDDDKFERFYVEETDKEEPCVWLAARMDTFRVYCEVDHPSGARDICAETCEKCKDKCQDTTKVFRYGRSDRNCLWLKLRPSMQDKVCREGGPAALACPETCDKCDGTAFPTVAPVEEEIEIESPVATPIEEKSEVELPVAAPIEEEVETDSPVGEAEDLVEIYNLPSATCDDAKFGGFFVMELLEQKSCVWLSQEPEWQATLCLPDNFSFALFVCPETCGACSDDCEDLKDAVFEFAGEDHDCLWLANNPDLHIDLCMSDDIRSACQETCNVCDTPV